MREMVHWPGFGWLMPGVTPEENRAAWAANYTGPIDYEAEFDLEESSDSNEIWRTRDNREVPYAEMTDSHMLNSYRMLERNGRLGRFPRLAEIAGKRGLLK